MRYISFLKSSVIACISVGAVLLILMIWSQFQYNDGFPNFRQFQIYSTSAFLAMILVISILLERRLPNLSSFIILFLFGFFVFLTVGSYRYLFNENYASWTSAASGSSNLLTSTLINGGFLSFVSVCSYFLARLIKNKVQTK